MFTVEWRMKAKTYNTKRKTANYKVSTATCQHKNKIEYR